MKIDWDLKQLDLRQLENHYHRWRILREIFRQGLVDFFPEDELWQRVIAWGNLGAWHSLFTEDMRAKKLSRAGAEEILHAGKSTLYAYALRFARLPCGYRKKFLEGITEGNDQDRSSAAAYALLYGKYLSLDWVERLCPLTHSLWRSEPEAKAAIESFFGKRYALVSYRADRPLRWEYRPVFRIRGIPIFVNWSWRCDDQRHHGPFREALLSTNGRVRRKVILLKDQNGSYAYRADPTATTVIEALRRFYGLPSSFQGFDKEV